MNAPESTKLLESLRQRHPRYDPRVYKFVLDSLRSVCETLGRRRHISGPELVNGACALAIARYGPLARTVFDYWGIGSSEDLGAIVFALVDVGVLVKREEDRIEDFHAAVDFRVVFEREYPWAVEVDAGFEYQ